MNSHELCYATSDSPVKGFQYGGILVSNGDVGLEGVPDVKHARCNTGNTHGSIIELNGKYFVFYTDISQSVNSLHVRLWQKKPL